MSKRKSVASLILVTVVLAISAPAVLANSSQERGFLDRLVELRDLGRELDLSGVQRSEIRTIIERTRDENESFQSELRSNLHDAAIELLQNPGRTVLQSTLSRNAAPLLAMRTNAVEAAAEVVQVLTPQQRETLIAWIEARDGSN